MPTILLNNIRPGGKYLKNLKINSTEIKYVKRGDGKLFYDTLKDTTYSDITITSFLYATGIVPASGGSTSAPSYAYSQKITPVGYASSYSSSTVTSGASVSFSKVSGDGATVNSNTGVVTFSSRGTTYSASLRSAVVKITISLNGKTSTKEVTCYLSANLITAVTANSNVFSYANISASATSATPSTSHTPIFTFSSTSTSATIPSSTYGSLTTTCSYSIANTTTNGFTACNSSTGVLTATARGTTIGNARTSATVTKTLKYTWTPASGYGSAVNSGNLTKTATCTQNGNYVTAVTCTANTLSYAAIGAGATSSGTPTYNFGNAKFNYSSGSSAEGAPSSTYGTYSSSVKFTIANTTTNGFKGINASTGVLTSTSRGTTIGNARSSATVTCTLTMTWTPTSSYNAEGTKSGTKTATATCTLNGNYVTAISNQIDTFSYGSAVAKGGDVSPSISRSCTLTFSSGSSKAGCTTSAGYTGGTITNTVSYSGSATGATVNTSSGTVTWANRTTTIGNSRSVTVTATSSYTFTHDSSYNSGKAITGTAKTQTATCSQNANYVTAVGVNTNSLSYSNIGAGATSASPTSSHTPIFTFSSTSTSTTTPGSSYGTLTATVKYTLAASKNGFTAVNATSGVLTATARGTTIGNARTSDTVTKSLTYSWAHSSTYSGGGTKTSSASTKTATCTLSANLVTSVTTQVSYSIGDATAAGGTITATKSGSCTLKFSSGSSAAGQTSSGGYTGGTITVNSWSFSGSGTGATLDTSTGNVTWANRTVNIGNQRSIKVTASRTYSFTHDSTYGGTTITGSAGSASDTSYLAGNYVTKVTPAASSGYTTNVTYPNISAAGGTSTPALHGTTTYTFSSGSTGSAPSSTYGSATVTRSYSGTLATGFTKINATTGVVTASDRGTTEGAARSQTVTVKMTVTWTPTSSYNAAGTITGSVTHTPTCTQNANSKTLTSIKIVATQPDNTWLATSSWSTIPAGGHYLGVYGYYCYTWSSGDPSETWAGNLKTGLTYTTSMAEVHTNGGLHILNRTTTIGKARSGTVYWTYSGLTSNTLSFTLVANLVTAVTVNSNSLSYANAGAGATSQAATSSHSPKFTFTSGSSSTTTPSSTYGSLSATVTYSLATSQNGFTAVNSSTGALTCTSRGTTVGNARASATVTKSVTYKWTPTSGYGSAVTSAASKKTATCTQAGNYVTKIVASASSGYSTHVTYPNITAAGGTSTPTLSGTATCTFSSGSTGAVPSTTYGTTTYTRTYSGTLATGFTAINSSTGVVTASGRGTTFGNARSLTVKSSLTVKFVHASSYSAGGTVSSAALSHSPTCTLNGNYVTAVTPKASNGYSTHASYASNISAAGGTVSPTNHGLATYTFSSGGTITDGSTSWTTAGTTTYTRTYSATLATGFTSVTSAGAVTASGRGTTSGNARSQTVSAKLTVKFVHSSTYSAGGTKEGSVTHSITCTLNHNNPSTVYNAPTIASASSSDIPASGGTFAKSWLTVKYSQTAYYSYPSGSNTSSSPHSIASSATATQAMISFTGTAPKGSNLGSTAYSRTSKGSVTVTVTANSKTSSGKSVIVYQQANSYSDAINSISGSASYGTWAWNGTLAKLPTITCTATYIRTWTSGSSYTVTSSVTPKIDSSSVSDTTNWSIVSTTASLNPKASNPSFSLRSVKVTINLSYGGKTTSVTCYGYLAAKPSYRIRVTNHTLYDADITFGSSSACSYNQTYISQVEMHLCTANNFCDIPNNNTSITVINNGGSTSTISSNYWTLYVIQKVYRNSAWRWGTCGSFEWVAQKDIDVSIQPTYSDM